MSTVELGNVSEYALVGMAIIGAQRVEFLLYGLGSHLVYLPEYRGKRFRDLDPESFLRGDPKELKETLGGLVKAFGERLLVNEDEIGQFVDHRNLIAHNYWRLTKANLKGGNRLENPEEFLLRFIEQCTHWEKVLKGLLTLTRQEQAARKGEDMVVTDDEVKSAEYFRQQVEARFQGKSGPVPHPPMAYDPNSAK